MVFCITVNAQPVPLSTKSKKAEKAYNAAMTYLQQYQYGEATKQLGIAKKEDPNFVEAYLLQANLYMETREWQKAIDEFRLSFAINPSFFPAAYYDCAQAELKLAKYEDAKKDFDTFLKMKRPSTSAKLVASAENGLATCDFAMNAMKNPVPFKPVNMGASVNTDACEYFPNVTADDNTFLFTRNREQIDPNTGAKMRSQEDFYISFRDANGDWSVARNLGPPINTPANEGAPSLSADGRYLFFAACEEYDGYGGGRQGFGSCDIFFSQKINGQWSKTVNVGAPLNTSSWETQPSFSTDGKTLYFISNRPGGFGSGDIWMCELKPDGKWTPPMNLGETINTAGNEEAVFIHPDNQTLYFASDGHVGMGGLDLYVCRRDSTGKWGKPVNLGYPINTGGDESGLIVNGTGNLAYYSSDREGGFGCDDIYMFELPPTLRPVPVTYMKGKTFDKKTNVPVGAAFELIDLATGNVVIASASDPKTGEFLVCLPVNKNYALNVSATGYCFYSESFMLKEVSDPNKPYQKNVPLSPIEVGASVILNNVFFETNKYDLKKESQAELLKLVAFMKANPNVRIEISGHTDNVGDKKSNQILSENRAKSVFVFLVQNGVEATRMTYKGYGDTQPVVPNDSPENRQKNRRTEFKIIEVRQ
ncbi:MAG: OmpA family protein [Bacteroidia bacterium]